MIYQPPMIVRDVCAEFGMNASAVFGPEMIWQIGGELVADPLAYSLLAEAAFGTAEEVVLDRMIAKTIGNVVLSTVIWPYRIYRIYEIIKRVDAMVAKPEVRQTLEGAIRRVCGRRSVEGADGEATTEHPSVRVGTAKGTC